MSRQIFSSCIHVLASISSIPLHGVCRLSVLSSMSRQISTVLAHVIGTHTFSLPTGEKNVTSQNVEAADAKVNFSDTSNNIITYPDDPA